MNRNRTVFVSRGTVAVFALCLAAFFVTACENSEADECGPESTSSACTGDEATTTQESNQVVPNINVIDHVGVANAINFTCSERSEDAGRTDTAARKPGSSPNGNGPTSYTYDLSDLGDVNADGKVNVVDLVCTQLTALATMGGTEMPKCLADYVLADIDCDGTVNVLDVQLVIQKSLGCDTTGCASPFSPVIDSNENGIHDQCETQTDPCASNTCKNGATCVASGDTYTCECAAGFSGTQCDVCKGDYEIGVFPGSTSPDLVSVDDLAGCKRITGNLMIHGPDVASLAGLENLTIVGGSVFVWFTKELKTLKGLDGLTEVGGGLHVAFNSGLTDLTGLGNLQKIGKDDASPVYDGISIGIAFNGKLMSLAGLSALTTVDGSIYVEHNPVLTDLSGFDLLQVIAGDFEANDNDMLPTCEVVSLVESFDASNALNGGFEITDNFHPCDDNPCGTGTCELDCSQPDEYICI